MLLAEDNVVNQKLAVRLLEKEGHSVVAAGNGQEALAALVQSDFDAILMDVQMPEMSGLEATAAIREKEKTTGKHQLIIALTAHAMKGDRERCLEGMAHYSPSPFRATNSSQHYAGLMEVLRSPPLRRRQRQSSTRVSRCSARDTTLNCWQN